MNKILIVGHESTQYQKLERILQSYGMLKPALSHTHKMTPQQIGQQIAKAAKIFPSDKSPISKKTTTRRKTKTTINDAKNVPISNSETVVTRYSQKHPKKYGMLWHLI